ncbi:MAG: DUF2813 domain-containing protein [Butyrivibrio sp.]|nr:DUF2813 domain-containing protein [Butyrivibrio sp.]
MTETKEKEDKMNIHSIKLNNFRGFNDISLELNGQTTVLYGVNGVGKSSILRAIDLVYASIIGRLMNKKRLLAELSVDDIHYNKAFARTEIAFELDSELLSYSRKIDIDGNKTHKKKNIDLIVDAFRKKYIGVSEVDEDGNIIHDKPDSSMPIFANYGVNRLVIDVPVLNDTRNYQRIDAFENAIESRIDFKSFFSWFKQKEDLENEMVAQFKGRKIENVSLPILDAVRRAMLAMFPEFDSVRFDRAQNEFVFEKNGARLNINQLSDGEKCTIALFGDIARRMAIANDGYYDDPLLVGGVVLVDEVDLHLHPLWQRDIIGKLRNTFPNIQFILTTHSPQVLGGLSDDVVVYAIKELNGSIKAEKMPSFYGWDTNIILEEGMNTPRVAAEMKEHIDNMYSLYDNGEYDEAEKEADWIDAKTAGHNDCVSGMRVMISRRRRLQNSEKN